LHVDHEELVVFVASIDIILLLVDDAGPEIGVSRKRPTLEPLEERVGESGKNVLEHVAARQGESLDVFDCDETEFCLCVVQHIIIAEEIFRQQCLGQLVSFIVERLVE